MIRRLFLSLSSILIISGILSSAFISTAVAAPITVDSTSETYDGVCGPPSEDCTIREAIHAVNTGVGKKIDFDPTVFPPGEITAINLSIELPPITESGITIDGSGAGVAIDGGGTSLDGIVFESGSGIALTNVTVRSIIIRYFQGSGIRICGGTLASNCEEPVSKVSVSHVTAKWNDTTGIHIMGSTITKANVQHAFIEGNGSYGIYLRATTGDINKPQVSKCTATANNGGIRMSGDSIINAKIADNAISRNSGGYGIRLNADYDIIHPKLTGNTFSDNHLGIYVVCDETMKNPTISDNHITGNGTHGIWASAGSDFNGGQFKGNVVTNNAWTGMTVTRSAKVKFQKNRVVNNGETGMAITSGSKNQIKNNIVSDNGINGISLTGSGQGSTIQGNQVNGNQNVGIWVNVGNTNAQIKGNIARGNDANDLYDGNIDCDSNSWKGNTFVTRSQDCIQ